MIRQFLRNPAPQLLSSTADWPAKYVAIPHPSQAALSREAAADQRTRSGP
jgi:hypothetical protein